MIGQTIRAAIYCICVVLIVGCEASTTHGPIGIGEGNAPAVQLLAFQASPVQAIYNGHGTGGILDRPSRDELFAMQMLVGPLVTSVPLFHPKSSDGTHLAVSTDAKFSWRDAGLVAMPSAENDQYKAGFCYVFASVAALESSWMISHPGQNISASEQHIANWIDIDGVRGGKASHAMRFLVAKGTTSNQQEPYLTSPTSQPSPSFKVTAKDIQGGWPLYKADATDFVASDAGIPSAAAMKQAIIDHGPIVCFILAGGEFANFFNQANASNKVIIDDVTDGNHFVLVTGWDDDKPYDGGKGAWEVRNSWGPSFGDHGFAWVKYGIRDITDNAMWVHMP